MERRYLPKTEFSRPMGYKALCTQSYLLGRFVCNDELSPMPFPRYPQRRMNTADLAVLDHRTLLGSPTARWRFLQTDPVCRSSARAASLHYDYEKRLFEPMRTA